MKTIGDKIKKLRIEKGMSQTDLANKLNLSNQAISKWENNFSLPDINLLPEIASIFGINIDDLFEYTKEKQYEKISNTIGYGYKLNNNEFNNFEEFLMDEIKKDSLNHKAISLLGELYIYQASCLNDKAIEYGKKALELKPNTKYNINIINSGYNGALFDWNVRNHHELIEYYIKTLKLNPENKRLYFYLLDNLIEDGRYNDATYYLQESFKNNPDNLNEYYEILIDEKKFGFNNVKDRYYELVTKYQDWRILFSVADTFAQNECYTEAIDLWYKAFEVQEKPRYTDYFESISQAYIMLNDYNGAIEALKNKIKLLKEEWGIKFGKEVNKLNERIKKLEEKS